MRCPAMLALVLLAGPVIAQEQVNPSNVADNGHPWCRANEVISRWLLLPGIVLPFLLQHG